jgi:hypothetical protein
MCIVEMKGKGMVQTYTLHAEVPSQPKNQRKPRVFGTAIHQNVSKFKIDLKTTPQQPLMSSAKSIQLNPTHRVQESSRIEINMYTDLIQTR